MDISIAASRRTWVPLVAVAVAAAGIAAYVLMRPESADNHRSETGRSGVPVTVEQAPWRIRTYATGATSKLTKVEEARLRKQRGPLIGLVKELHSALFLEPSTRKQVVRRLFSASAAASFLSARPGPGSGAEAVATVRRRGRIGIQADSAVRAAGTVTVVARVESGDKAVRLGYRSDLFLEKKNGHWQVVAFEIDQRRLPERKERKEASRKQNGKERRSGGKEGGSK